MSSIRYLLSAVRYELEKLRCSACGEMFTALLPETAGLEKYTPQARAVLALSRREADREKPVVMSDALAANGLKDEAAVIRSHCLSHGQRQFTEIDEVFPEACTRVITDLKKVFMVWSRRNIRCHSSQKRVSSLKFGCASQPSRSTSREARAGRPGGYCQRPCIELA